MADSNRRKFFCRVNQKAFDVGICGVVNGSDINWWVGPDLGTVFNGNSGTKPIMLFHHLIES